MSVPRGHRYRMHGKVGTDRMIPVGHAREWRDRLKRCQFDAPQAALDRVTKGRKQ